MEREIWQRDKLCHKVNEKWKGRGEGKIANTVTLAFAIKMI